jgi:hypothetical protein
MFTLLVDLTTHSIIHAERYDYWNVTVKSKMDLREIGWDGGDWIDLAQDRDQWRALARAVLNLRVP